MNADTCETYVSRAPYPTYIAVCVAVEQCQLIFCHADCTIRAEP